LGTACLGRDRPVAATWRTGPLGCPPPQWCWDAGLVYAPKRTYCSVITVQQDLRIGQELQVATEFWTKRAELAMAADATGDRPGPPEEGPRATAAASEQEINPLQRLIHQRLRERNWSYGEVARRGGLPRSTVYTLAMTRNLARPPRPATIDALAKGLDVPVSAVRAAAAESTGLHYYDEVPVSGDKAPAADEHPSDRERQLLIASIDELTPEDRRHVAALVESLRKKAEEERTERLAAQSSRGSGVGRRPAAHPQPIPQAPSFQRRRHLHSSGQLAGTPSCSASSR
jgi:transcriptional regulator with XRE-family HTH domain